MHPIVITGSQSGMGLAIRNLLETRGYRIIGVDLPGKGAEVIADLSTTEGRTGAVNAILSQSGVLGGIVCNAGVDVSNIPLVLELNYLGSVELLMGLRSALASAGSAAAVVTVSNSIFITPQIPEEPVTALLHADLQRAEELLRPTPRYAYSVSKFALAKWIRKHPQLRIGLALESASTAYALVRC